MLIIEKLNKNQIRVEISICRQRNEKKQFYMEIFKIINVKVL